MLSTNRIRTLVRPCLALLCAGGLAFGQEPATPAAPAAAPDLSSLKQSIDQQAQQIQALTKEIAELKSLIKKGQPARLINQRPPTPGESEPTPEKPEPTPAPAPAPSPAAAPPKAEPAPAAADGSKHTVAKGETLTSIAKRYNIPLAELQKFNQIEDDRKLQIGQVLNIPSTASKTPEPPNQIKENP